MIDINSNKEGFPKFNLPPAELKFRRVDDVLRVFDPLRRKYVVATPEELVRQQFTSWMIRWLHYPMSLMANEIGIELNGTKKRCDTVVFNPDGSPFMIVEYKSPDIVISQLVFDQIVRYNMVLHATYLVVSNGFNHYCCVMDYEHASYHFIPMVPDYINAKQNLSIN